MLLAEASKKLGLNLDGYGGYFYTAVITVFSGIDDRLTHFSMSDCCRQTARRSALLPSIDPLLSAG